MIIQSIGIYVWAGNRTMQISPWAVLFNCCKKQTLKYFCLRSPLQSHHCLVKKKMNSLCEIKLNVTHWTLDFSQNLEWIQLGIHLSFARFEKKWPLMYFSQSFNLFLHAQHICRLLLTKKSRKCFSIRHYKPLVRTTILPSHTTYAVCVSLMHGQ